MIASGGDPSLGPIYSEADLPWHIHDPSRMVATDGILMIADTGKAQEDGYRYQSQYTSLGSKHDIRKYEQILSK